MDQLGYDRNRIFYYLIPVLLTGTGICHCKSGSGRTGTGFFITSFRFFQAESDVFTGNPVPVEPESDFFNRIQLSKNRISRSDRNSGRNRNFTNATPERTEIAENEKTELLVNLKGDT